MRRPPDLAEAGRDVAAEKLPDAVTGSSLAGDGPIQAVLDAAVATAAEGGGGHTRR